MASKWRPSTWGEEISLEYGKSLKGYRESNGPIPVYGSNGAVGWTEKALADGPGVILGRKGAYRGVRYSKDPFFVIDTAYYVKPKTELDMQWLYYAIIHHKLGEIDDGSPIPSTTRAAVYVADVDIPPLPEQKRIAHILGSLDDKIELNRKMNETLEGMAQALFKSWFVDFDPVIDNILLKNMAKYPSPNLSQRERDSSSPAGRSGDEGKLFEGIPEELMKRAEIRKMALKEKNSSPSGRSGDEGLTDEIRQIFPSEFELSDELGWIPKGWEVNTIGDEVTVVGGGTPSTKNPDYWDNGNIHWTTPKDLSNHDTKILLNTDRQITEKGLAAISSGLLPVNTVLMSSRAPVGYLAMAKVPLAINQGYIGMKCEKVLTPEYVIQWAESVMDDIKQRAGGTTFAEISKKNFKSIPVIIPTEKVLKQYSEMGKEFYCKIEKNNLQINTLSELRDTLLPKLLSGELNIKDAEKKDGENR